METSDLKHHYSQQFNSELEEIRSRVLAMGGLVERQLEMGIESINSMEPELAEAVVSNDCEVNACDVDIDERCTKILALRQPAASDLRLVLAVIKTTADLERIGDEAKRVAHMAMGSTDGNHGKNLVGQIIHLGKQVQWMLHRALDAFARMDVDAALQIMREDVNIDLEYENFMRHSMSFMMDDPNSIPGVLDLIWSARALERIGDRCCNICEYVVYFVKGKDVRHTSLEELEKELGE